MLGQMEPMLARMSSSMFGAQIGRAVGLLAGEVLDGQAVRVTAGPEGLVVGNRVGAGSPLGAAGDKPSGVALH